MIMAAVARSQDIFAFIGVGAVTVGAVWASHKLVRGYRRVRARLGL